MANLVRALPPRYEVTPRTISATSGITTSLGGAASITDAFTLACIIKRTSDTGTCVYLLLGTVSPDVRLQFYSDSGNNLRTYTTASGNSNAAIAVNAADGWILIATTKPAGTSAVRHHKYVYSTNTFTHTATGSNLATTTPTGSNTIGGAPAGSFGANADFAIAAGWNVDSSDLQIEALAFDLTVWFQRDPKVLWLMDGGPYTVDASGHGTNQTSRTGTKTATPGALPDRFRIPSPTGPTFLYKALGTFGAAVSVPLSPATITVTPVALAPSVGGTSPALSPASVTVTPVALAPSPGAISLALTAASITVTPVAFALTVGAVSLTLPPTHIAISPEGACALTDESGRELTDEDGRVLVGSSTCNNLGITNVAGDQTPALSPAVITITPVALTIAGAVTLALSPAVITVTPVGLAVTAGATSLALSPAVITVTPVALTVSLAGQLALAPAVITVAPVAVTLVAAVNLTLGTAIITVTPVGLAPTVGAVTVPLSPALIAVLAVALAFAPGVGCIHLTLDELGTIEATVAPLHACAVTLGPHAVTVVLSVPHACTVTLSELDTITAELEECAP